MAITLETDNGTITVTPEQLQPLPPRIGGKGRKVTGRVNKVRSNIILVDWDAVERMEAKGEKVTPQNFPTLGGTPPAESKPIATGGSFAW